MSRLSLIGYVNPELLEEYGFYLENNCYIQTVNIYTTIFIYLDSCEVHAIFDDYDIRGPLGFADMMGFSVIRDLLKDGILEVVE